MNEKIRRKDIYLADFGNTVGCEEKGKRPVLIVQNDFGNKYSSTTIVIPLTKRVETKQRIPTHIEIEPFGKMPFKATILAEQIKVIDKRRLQHYIDTLPDKYEKRVNYAMKVAIGLYEPKITKRNYKKDEPVYARYRKIYSQKSMLVKRYPNNRYYRHNYERWKEITRRFLDDIENGKKTYEEFNVWLDKEEKIIK